MKLSHRFFKFAIGGLLAALAGNAGLGASAQSFSRVADHLDTDGDFLAFADFTGEAAALGEHLTAIYAAYLAANPEAMPLPLDFTELFGQLGFDALQSIGYSSKKLDEGLHRNRNITLFEGEPRGLLRLYDLSPRRFRAAEIAPADASLALDLSLNLTALSDTTLEIAASIMGPLGEGLVQGGLQQQLLPSGLTGDELIRLLSNPITLVARQTLESESGAAVFELYAEVQGAAALVDHFAHLSELNPEVTVKAVGGETIVDLRSFLGEGETGLFVKRATDSEQLIVYTSERFLSEIDNGKSLANTDHFKRLAAHLPGQAAGFTYQSSTAFEDILQMIRNDPDAAPYLPAIEVAFNRLLANFLKPQATAYYAVDGGIRTDSYAHYSIKDFAAIVPLAIAGGAAAAIPAYQKVKQASQEKEILNNLRMFAVTAQQYMLETGAEEVTYDDIVGPEKYIAKLESVAGESYENLVVTADDYFISIELPDGRVISYDF